MAQLGGLSRAGVGEVLLDITEYFSRLQPLKTRVSSVTHNPVCKSVITVRPIYMQKPQ